MSHIIPIILCGGIGARLWPLSASNRPKPLLYDNISASMLQQTVRRVADRSRYKAPYVICQTSQWDCIADHLSGEDIAGYITEPAGRNTAAAITAAALLIRQHSPDALLLILPSDHQITDRDGFEQKIDAARQNALHNYLVTFGIVPDRPATDYGYIQRGPAIGEWGYQVISFIEKPEESRAHHLLTQDNVYWNSGMFLFPLPLLLEEMEQYALDILAVCEQAVRYAVPSGAVTQLGDIFHQSPSVPIDVALMERTQRAAVVPAALGWRDLGTYQSLWESAAKDAQGNTGTDITHRAQNNFVHTPGLRTVLAGVSDLVVVQSDGLLLVAHRDAADDIKALALRATADKAAKEMSD